MMVDYVVDCGIYNIDTYIPEEKKKKRKKKKKDTVGDTNLH